MTATELRERRPPRATAWREQPLLGIALRVLGPVSAASSWQHGRITCISALELAKAPDGTEEKIPQWHVSISRQGKRPRPVEIARVRQDFLLADAEEDNHHPGNAVHLWMPVDPRRRVDCECKSDETIRVDADGYRYSEQAGTCAACDIASVTGRPCREHAA